jgi:hypothetical protein
MPGAVPPLPQYVFMAWCLNKQEIRHYAGGLKHRDNFTFGLLGCDAVWWCSRILTSRSSYCLHSLHLEVV